MCLASIASGVITTDVNLIITLYNSAAEAILGQSRGDVLNRSLRAALPVLYSAMQPVLAAIVEDGRGDTIEVDLPMAGRDPASLVLKLTPLRVRDQTEGIAIVLDDLSEIKQRDATLAMVRRYLPPAMVDQIQSVDGLALGGERRMISVLFVETLSIDALAAELHPVALLERVNQYLTASAEAIHRRRGLVDKFVGSEVMGLFNTQLNPDEDHAWQAVLAALTMLDELRALSARLGDPAQLCCRIGVHSGVATLGNVGNATRREFTAIGDTINLAKRLQEHATYGQLIISEDTYRLCRDRIETADTRMHISQHATIQVRGRRQPVTVYDVLCAR